MPRAIPTKCGRSLPAATRNIRLATWSPLIDRRQLLTLARYAKQYGAISTLPNFTQLVPSFIEGGKTLQATVGSASFVTLRLDGQKVDALKSGKYNVAVDDAGRRRQLPSARHGRRQVDEHREEADRHLDAEPQAGRLPLRLRRKLQAERLIPGSPSGSVRGAGRGARLAPRRSQPVEQLAHAVDDRVRAPALGDRVESTRPLMPLLTRMVRAPPIRPRAMSMVTSSPITTSSSDGRAELLADRP